MRRGKLYWQAQYEAQLTVNEHVEEELAAARERIAELEDSWRARSLAEFRAVRPVAMQIPPDEDNRDDWGWDPTGLVGGPLPPLTEAEQEIADRLHS